MNYRGAVGNAREYRGIEEGEEAERELGEELVVVGEGGGEGRGGGGGDTSAPEE